MTSAKKAAGQRAATAKRDGAGRRAAAGKDAGVGGARPSADGKQRAVASVGSAKVRKETAAKKLVAPAKKSTSQVKKVTTSAASKPTAAKKTPPAKKAAPAKKTTTAKKAAPPKSAKKSAAAKSPAAKKATPAKPRAAAKPAASRPAKGAPAVKKAAAKTPNPRPYAKDTKFLDEQRVLLEAERAVYQEQAAALKAEADSLAQEREPGDVQFDEESGEGGTVTVDRERDLALSAQALVAVEEIDDALSRIANGTYGVCERCRQPIPKPRLRALPYARLCVACKSGGLSRR